ncbi:MAG TPA: phospholipase D-like domain-containing protein [bacterium]|nr:phospholipase D-like domain-containing protein [bacterium]HPJ72351.1 phospholipase D-like domain-containing protein [bacterium]HPQ65251.1 phospholipase D-like domain-containing protein [bacterium]
MKTGPLLAAALLAAAAAGGGGEPAPPAEPPPWIRIFFSPEDDVAALLTGLIDSSRCRVWAAFYSLDLPGVAEALLWARERGVDVRVVMDDAAGGGVRSRSHQLRRAGILVTDASPGDFMHNKFMVVDGFITLTGSCNPTETGVTRDNNNVVVVACSRLAFHYQKEFLEMWEGAFGNNSPASPGGHKFRVEGVDIEVWFAPEEDCAGRLIELIESARESVVFSCFAFTLTEVAEALIRKHEEGVDVRGILERGQGGPYCVYRLLADCGVDVRWDQNLYYLHHKFFVIDGTTVATGSFNPSRHARDDNDENLVIIGHPAVAARFLREFEKLARPVWE